MKLILKCIALFTILGIATMNRNTQFEFMNSDAQFELWVKHLEQKAKEKVGECQLEVNTLKNEMESNGFERNKRVIR